jgi:uncharacterized membrane protein (UPF0127 family)
MKRSLAITIAALLLAIGCNSRAQNSAPPSATIATQPAARVIFPDGFPVRIEIAADEATREQGLMYRDRLADDAGMLFFFTKTDEYSFWMKDTLIPLDIIWIDEQKKIVHIGTGIPPCRADPCPSYAPHAKAMYVLEVASGVAAKHRLAEGNVLRFEGTERVVAR